MADKLFKANLPYGVSPVNQFRYRMGGQVPNRERRELMKLVETKPQPMTAARMLEHTKPCMTVDAILDGLGMDPAQYGSWRKFLQKALSTGNELVMRRDLLSKMIDDGLGAELRKALFQRSMNYYGRRVQKSIITIDELHKTLFPQDGDNEVVRERYLAYTYGQEPEGMGKVELDSQIENLCAQKAMSRKTFDEEYGLVKGETVARTYQVKGHPDTVAKIDKLLLVMAHCGSVGASRDMRLGIDGDGHEFVSVEGIPKKLVPEVRERELDRHEGVRVHGLELTKAEAKGGSYHKRVPRKSGKGYTYYYDSEQYGRSKNAHVDGKEASTQYINNSVRTQVEKAGDTGCDIQHFKSLVKQYGSEKVGHTLKEACGSKGGLTFKGGKFYLKKSERYTIEE